MSIKSEITRLQNAKTAIATAIKNKGVSVPTGTKLDEMSSLINNISTGTSTSDATAIASDVLQGKTAYNATGKITGTIASYSGEHTDGAEEGTTPEGTIEIKTNGVHDVTNYANADVNVPIPDGYIIPSGTKTITSNGTAIDVRTYQYVNVSVASSSGSEDPGGPGGSDDTSTDLVTASVVIRINYTGSVVVYYYGISEDTGEPASIRKVIEQPVGGMVPIEVAQRSYIVINTTEVMGNAMVFFTSATGADLVFSNSGSYFFQLKTAVSQINFEPM